MVSSLTPLYLDYDGITGLEWCDGADIPDIYIAAVSASHNVAAKDVWIAEVSTIVETSVPEREILPGLQLLGTVLDK